MRGLRLRKATLFKRGHRCHHKRELIPGFDHDKDVKPLKYIRLPENKLNAVLHSAAGQDGHQLPRDVDGKVCTDGPMLLRLHPHVRRLKKSTERKIDKVAGRL